MLVVPHEIVVAATRVELRVLANPGKVGRKLRKSPFRRSQKAAQLGVGVCVPSRDQTVAIDSLGIGSGRSLRVERRHRSIGGTYKAVAEVGKVIPSNDAMIIDAE